MSDEKVTVRATETLWRVAERELGDGHRWLDIFVKNMKSLETKVFVRPGTELVMPAPEERWRPEDFER